MLKFLIQVIILGGFFLNLAHFLPDFQISHAINAFVFAGILSILNRVLTPLLIAISFPITVLTAGAFALVINIFIFWLSSLLSYGITISSLQAALFGGIAFWIITLFINRRLSFSA